MDCTFASFAAFTMSYHHCCIQIFSLHEQPIPKTFRTCTSLNLILWLDILVVALLDLNLIPLHALKTPQINRHDLLPRLLIPLTIFRKVLRRNGQLADVDANPASRAELVGLNSSSEDVGSCGGCSVDGDLRGGGVGEDCAVLAHVC